MNTNIKSSLSTINQGDITFNPVGKYTLNELIKLVQISYGDQYDISQYYNTDYVDTFSDDFHNYWIDIYTHLSFAYGVKYGYILLDCDTFVLNYGKNNYNFDLFYHYGLANESEPLLNYASTQSFYEYFNIEQYLPYV